MMTVTRLAAGLLFALVPAVAAACPGHDKTEQASVTYGEIGLDELARLVDTKAVTVVDANRPERYAQGHVPGALHATTDAQGKLTGDALPADKTTKLVFYCHSEKCKASHLAAQAALNAGYTDVSVFSPGIVAWEKAGKAVEKAKSPAATATPAAKNQG